MDITLDIDLHFECAVPVFKREHRPPVQPEVRVQHLIIKEVRNPFVLQLLVRCKEQLHDLHRALIGDREFAIRVRVLPAVDRRSAQRIVRVLLVQPVIFVQYRNTFGLDGRNRTKQIPHTFKMVVHFTSAPHHIADILISIAVTGTARNRVLFENVYVFPFHLPVSDQKAGC